MQSKAPILPRQEAARMPPRDPAKTPPPPKSPLPLIFSPSKYRKSGSQCQCFILSELLPAEYACARHTNASPRPANAREHALNASHARCVASARMAHPHVAAACATHLRSTAAYMAQPDLPRSARPRATAAHNSDPLFAQHLRKQANQCTTIANEKPARQSNWQTHGKGFPAMRQPQRNEGNPWQSSTSTHTSIPTK